MILLMSEYRDNSTIYVAQWLLHWDIPFVRIDCEEQYKLEYLHISNDGFDYCVRGLDGKTIKMSEIRAVWYRRGELNFVLPNLRVTSDGRLRKALEGHLLAEKVTLEQFFYRLMKDKPHIGTFDTRAVSKLEVLFEAARLGIEIPRTAIVTEKKELKKYPFHSIITKAIREGFHCELDTGRYTTYTEGVHESDLPAAFFPTLFQEAIEKEADIRVFYLSGNFYSMAIRSQSNIQTKTDFRKYLRGRGNRLFPFHLPQAVEQKLDLLMKRIGLETGSIDLIFTKDGRFIFLEVNPVGQFGMVSFPCNYYLEKQIALELVKMMEKTADYG